jgi:hypothetical protein
MPKHLRIDNEEKRVLVNTEEINGRSSGHALRVCRLFEVLISQARIGIFKPMTVRADVLLPVIARLVVEVELNLEAIVKQQLEPIAEEAGVPLPPDFADPRISSPARPRPRPRPRLLQLPPPPPPPPPPLPASRKRGRRGTAAIPGVVPEELRRDFAILKALKHKLGVATEGVNGTSVALDDICAQVRHATETCDATSASLKQAVAHVVKRAVERAIALGQGGVIAYSTKRQSASARHHEGVVADAAGVAALTRFVDHAIQQMRFNALDFVAPSGGNWSVSKRAKKAARASTKTAADAAQR